MSYTVDDVVDGLLARIVAAIEEIENGEAGVAYAILLDLAVDVERAAA
ncbi:MAG TPA: hypothetical protein VFX13_11095 [Gaiellales bacterium]|nr:hypothetical protein [Gaiellales bacterium]